VRKLVLSALALVFMLTLIYVPAQAKKAGEIEDDIYTDFDHNFSFKVPNGWSANIKKSKYALRVALDQKSPVPPRHFQGELRDYMQIPTIDVIVDTTSLETEEFVDSLLSPDFKSRQKKGLMRYLDILEKPTYEIQKRSKLTFHGHPATVLEVRQPYSMEVSTRGSDRAEVINDYKTGLVFLTERDGKLFIISMLCEYQTSNSILGIVNSLINSIEFNGGEEPEKAEEKG